MVTATVDAEVRGSWLRAIWGGLLSLLIPGVGQIYARLWRLGAVLMAVNLVFEGGVLAFSHLAPPTPWLVATFFGLATAFWLLINVGAAAHALYQIRKHPDASRPKWYRSAWLAAIVYIPLATMAALVWPAGWRSFSIPSGSSLPGIQFGDVIIADVRGSNVMPDYGDVVVFVYPRDHSIDYIKRVIGLPGDHVQLRRGLLYLNDQVVARQPIEHFPVDDGDLHMVLNQYTETLPNRRSYPIVKATDDGIWNNTPEYVVPPNAFFVLGDNRDNSVDSRMVNAVGFVPLQNLIGKAWTITWSRDHARILSPVN